MGEVRWRRTVGPAEIAKISVGSMDNNVYLLKVGGDALLIDGSNEADTILAELGDARLTTIVQTHGHYDHVQALDELVRETGASVLVHPADREMIPVSNDTLDEGGDVGVGPVRLEVLHTPGHTPGSISLVLREGDQTHLFSGDTLFPGGPGNTFGDGAAFDRIMDSLEEKLFVLPDDTPVYPGHGADTTIGTERPDLGEWRARGW